MRAAGTLIHVKIYSEEIIWAAKVRKQDACSPFHKKNKKFSTFLVDFAQKFRQAKNIF
jgi:hypothetical protein